MPSMFSTEGEPPVKARGRKARPHPSALLLAQMRGEWAKVYISENRQSAYNKATEIRNGKIKGYKIVGQFEAMSPRPTPEGWVVWARCQRVNPEYKKAGDPDE